MGVVSMSDKVVLSLEERLHALRVVFGADIAVKILVGRDASVLAEAGLLDNSMVESEDEGGIKLEKAMVEKLRRVVTYPEAKPSYFE